MLVRLLRALLHSDQRAQEEKKRLIAPNEWVCFALRPTPIDNQDNQKMNAALQDGSFPTRSKTGIRSAWELYHRYLRARLLLRQW